MFLIVLHIRNHDSVFSSNMNYNLSNIDLKYVENFDIVFPEVLYKTIRKRKDLTSTLSYEYDNYIQLIKIGDWQLELYPENNLLLKSNFRTEWIYDDEITHKNITNCIYKNGFIVHMKNSFVTITICDSEISGFFDLGYESYFIQPLTLRSNAHILYKLNKSFSRKKRSYFMDNNNTEQWEYFNLTGDIIDLATERNDEEQLENASENSNENQVPANITRKWHREDLDFEEFGYFYDSAWETDMYSGEFEWKNEV